MPVWPRVFCIIGCQSIDIAAIRIHDIDVAVSIPIGHEGNLAAIRGPAGPDVIGLIGCNPPDILAVAAHDVDLHVSVTA